MKLIGKSLLMLLGFIMIALSPAKAQFKQLAEGPKFTEPEDGFVKIIQLKNGGTFYTSVFFKDGINTRIYDANHAEKATNTIAPAAGFSKYEEVEAVFEIHDHILLFISDFDDHAPTLYRFTIDENTGKLLEETTVAQLNKSGMFASNDEMRSFNVKKDPFSDNYAICLFNISVKDKSKRLEIIHYGDDNKEISRSFCFPNNEDYFMFLDMVVLGREKVCAFFFEGQGTYGFTRKGKITMGTIEKNAVAYHYASFPADIILNWGIAKYNPVSKEIIFLTVIPQGKHSEEYAIAANLIDPSSNKFTALTDLGWNTQLNNAYNERFDKKNGYAGMPQNIFINNDGSFSIMYEEMLVSTKGGQYGTRTDTRMGKLVLANYDMKGKLISNYMVPKVHWMLFDRGAPFYDARKENLAQFLYRGNQYKSFSYINGSSGNFILINDTERNDQVVKDKFAEVQGVSDCDLYMYKMEATDIFPKRVNVFGQTTLGTKEHQIAMVTTSAYDRKNNIYVTLKLDKESASKKVVKLVWLQPQ